MTWLSSRRVLRRRPGANSQSVDLDVFISSIPTSGSRDSPGNARFATHFFLLNTIEMSGHNAIEMSFLDSVKETHDYRRARDRIPNEPARTDLLKINGPSLVR